MAKPYSLESLREEYLTENDRRGGAGQGITVRWFVTQRLDSSPAWIVRNVIRDLERLLIRDFSVLQDRSISGATAYYRLETEGDQS